jgi:hypothetical protein
MPEGEQQHDLRLDDAWVNAHAPPPPVLIRCRAGFYRLDERRVAIDHLLATTAPTSLGVVVPRPDASLDDRGSAGDVALGRRQYSMCYRVDLPELRPFCGPDWCSVHWPSAGVASFARTAREVSEAGLEVPLLPGTAGWYGNAELPLQPYSTMSFEGEDIPERRTRPLLVELANSSNSSNSCHLEAVHCPPGRPAISMPDLVRRYGALVDIGGVGYSGRLKYLLFSRRPLLLVERRYVEWFHADLEPFVHFVPVRSDLADLTERIRWVRDNPREARDMAERAHAFARERFARARLVERVAEVCRAVGR